MIDISLPARTLFHLGPVPVTNGMLGAVIVSVTLVGFSVLAARKFSIIPTRMQVAFEFLTDYILDQLETAFGSRKQARAFFPLFFTILLFITIANQFMLVPFVFEIVYDGVPLFRQPTADFAQPITLALLIVFLSHVLAFRISPIRHLSNFFPVGAFLKIRSVKDVANAFVDLFLGVLNIIGEFAKIISLAARLFGNIFAGTVMVSVIIGLAAFTQFLVPIPFIILSVFTGFIQAFVFMLLSIQYIAISVQGARSEEEEMVISS